MTNHPNRSQSATRKAMKRDGYKAFKVWCQDSNGGLALVSGWVVIQAETPPRAGEMASGNATRELAWSAAEDVYEQMMEWATR